MIVKFDPFREFDRLADQAWGQRRLGRSNAPIDVHRVGNEFVALFDLPGASPETIKLTVDKNDLTVTAERLGQRPDGAETLVRERPTGRFVRRLHLGDGVDLEHVDAEFENGVLKVTIPLAEEAKPRQVEVRVVPQSVTPAETDTAEKSAA
jgi:HSP20 family protein